MNLEEAKKQIEKNFGKGTIITMKDQPLEIEGISTGSILLNKALGIGGYPRGRIIEVFGPESSGKTTLALHGIAEAQKLGLKTAFIDVEHSLDMQYAQNIGVVPDETFLITQPNCGEEALEIVDTLVRSNEIHFIVVDSVAALTPKAELEGIMGQSHMGLQARLMSQALRKLSGIVSKTNCVLLFTNQIRMKIGVVFGNPETTTGGNALKFYASVRLDVRSKTKIQQNEEFIGNEIKVKIVKNKVAPPFKIVDTRIMYGRGIDTYKEVLDMQIKNGVIEKAGSWYKYKDDKIQGQEMMIDYVKENIEEFKID